MAGNIAWPRKSRELHNHHFDSTIWNDLVFRGDDIVIATYAKSGTTWMQQIVGQLLFDGDPDLSVAEMSPWLDLRVPPKEVKLPLVEAQTHRRFSAEDRGALAVERGARGRAALLSHFTGGSEIGSGGCVAGQGLLYLAMISSIAFSQRSLPKAL